jgi:iron complex transport system substrate-binding protein
VGAGSKVVGVTDYCDYPYNFSAWIEAGNLTSIGGFWNPPVEPIIALEPDLVLATSASEEAANTLRNMGYSVLILDPKNINDILKNILLVGRATDSDVEAGILVGTMRERIDNIIKKVVGVASKPKVYFEIWNDPLMSAGPGTWIHELINLAGGINIFENATSQWPIVSSEVVIQQNPDVMLYPYSHGVERFWGSFDEVKARPGWDEISAVQNDRLYEIDADIIARPGPRIVEALEILAQIIHPDFF